MKSVLKDVCVSLAQVVVKAHEIIESIQMVLYIFERGIRKYDFQMGKQQNVHFGESFLF
jgi:hypothetical protein